MRELVRLAEERDAFSRLGAGVFALAIAPVEELAPLQEKLGHGVTLLADPDGEAVRAFGMLDRPRVARSGTFLLDREGLVKHRWLPDSYRRRPEPREILDRAR